jgi:hypothetical protein
MSKRGKGTGESGGADQNISVGSLGETREEQPIQNDRVRLIRFLTGQEIIAELIEETDSHLLLRNPLAFAAHRAENSNQVHIAFGEFMPFTDEQECKIRNEFVLLCYTPEDTLVAQYRTTFGKIIIPQRDLKSGSLLTG